MAWGGKAASEATTMTMTLLGTYVHSEGIARWNRSLANSKPWASLYVERRNPETGEVELDGEQPPFTEATVPQLIEYYLRSIPDDGPKYISSEEIRSWYAAKNWFWRPKTLWLTAGVSSYTPLLTFRF